MKALGILREVQNSPNRESDDALVLKAVMDQLSILKTETTVITPEEFDRVDASGYDIIVPMCETYPRPCGQASMPAPACRRSYRA